jgi:hypothetical protein
VAAGREIHLLCISQFFFILFFLLKIFKVHSGKKRQNFNEIALFREHVLFLVNGGSKKSPSHSPSFQVFQLFFIQKFSDSYASQAFRSQLQSCHNVTHAFYRKVLLFHSIRKIQPP